MYGHINNVQYYSYFDTVVNSYLIHHCGFIISGSAKAAGRNGARREASTVDNGGLISVVAESGCIFRYVVWQYVFAAYHVLCRNPFPSRSTSSCVSRASTVPFK